MAPHLDRNSQAFLILLTIGIFGLQSTLAVVTSKGSPFLLSLGLSKPLISLVWTAGPVAGALMQPYFGVLSDRSRSSWGRRRPFIACGAALMAPSLLLLAWVRELSRAFGWLFVLDPNGILSDAILKFLAVANIWTYFFGFQVAQVGFRALIVDCAPPHLLDKAMVWATRWNCLGNLVCYGAGFLDLPSILPRLGASEFQILVLFAALIIMGTSATVCWTVEEDQAGMLVSPDLPAVKTRYVAAISETFRNIRRLSPNIWAIFQVQFYAWVGWFLFNYYITTYVGALHKREESERTIGRLPLTLLDEAATRYGSFALLLSAIVTLATTILGPLVLAYARRSSSSLQSLTLRNLWFAAQVVFAASMLSTFIPVRLLHTSVGTTALVTLVGMPWALTTWAPFSLIGEELNILNADDEASDNYDDEKEVSLAVVKGSGTVMSLYIAAINVPQLVATLSSASIFWLTDSSDVSLDGLGWGLKLSGAAAAVAAWRILTVVDRG